MPTKWYKSKCYNLKWLLLPGLFFPGKHLSIKSEMLSLHLKNKTIVSFKFQILPYSDNS